MMGQQQESNTKHPLQGLLSKRCLCWRFLYSPGRTRWREAKPQHVCLQAKRHLTSKMSECGAPTIPAGIQWLEAFFRDYYLRNIQADQVLTFTFIYKKIVERIKYKHLENAIKALLRCPGTGRQRIKKLTRFRAFKLAEVITIIFHWLCYRQWPL